MTELNLHPEAEQIEAYLEGGLDDAQRAVFESHLVGCSRCQGELEEWRALFTALTALPPIEPSPGFVDRVMAGVTVALASARAAAAVRWLPRTTKGWSLVAAFLALPMLGLGAAVSWLVAQPWASALSAEALLVLAWNGVSGGAAWVSRQVTTLVLQTDFARTLVSGARQFLLMAGATGVGLAAIAFCLAALGSAWILYHNLVRNSTREVNYAPYTL